MQSNTHERRFGTRMATDFGVLAYRHGHGLECRAVDLSAEGALFRRRCARPPPMVQQLVLQIGSTSVTTYARTVRSHGGLQAVRFVGLSDVDRLEIAEHLDSLEKRKRLLN